MSNSRPKPQTWPATFNHPREFAVAVENEAYLSYWQEHNPVLPHFGDDGNTSDSDSDSDDETTSDEEDEDVDEADVTEDSGPCPELHQRHQVEPKAFEAAQFGTAPLGRDGEVTPPLAQHAEGNEANREVQRGARELIEGLDAVRVFMAPSSIRDPEVPQTLGQGTEVIAFCKHAQNSETQPHGKGKRFAIVDDRNDAMDAKESAGTTKIVTAEELKYWLSIEVRIAGLLSPSVPVLTVSCTEIRRSKE
jgi:hypothetical protein